MSYVIVSDSSSNVFSVPRANFCAVPLKIRVGEKEYVDGPDVDLEDMVEVLKAYKGKSSSSCPNVQEWLDAFGDADEVYGVTITRNLSGSYNAAYQAAQIYMEMHPGRKVYIFDSFTAGAEQAMVTMKIAELAQQGYSFEDIKEKVLEFQSYTHTLFCLESLTNLARNGRVSPAVARIAGMLGIRLIGTAKEGRIEPIHKVRGHKKAMQTLVDVMAEWGYRGGMVRISECFAKEQANDLKELILSKWPEAQILIEPNGALCSYYAEVGGMIVGFEGDFCKDNHPGLFN